MLQEVNSTAVGWDNFWQQRGVLKSAGDPTGQWRTLMTKLQLDDLRVPWTVCEIELGPNGAGSGAAVSQGGGGGEGGGEGGGGTARGVHRIVQTEWQDPERFIKIRI